MKTILSILFLSMATMVMAQKTPKTLEKSFQTTAECNSCKNRIEGKLNYTKGIKFAELDVPSKVLTVKFKMSKISEKEIKEIVANLGYGIDDMNANAEAYEALPACCKVGGMEHED